MKFQFKIKVGSYIRTVHKQFETKEEALKYGLKTWKDELRAILLTLSPYQSSVFSLIYVNESYEQLYRSWLSIDFGNRKVGKWHYTKKRRKHEIIREYKNGKID
jgi:hypothetical protein